MPVSFFPLVLPVIFIVLLVRGARRGRASVSRAFGIVFSLLALVTLPFYVPGWWLMWRARDGDAPTLYRLAKWHEMHCERVGALILWPCQPDVLTGFACLERAAKKDFPPALYAVGVRLKHGEHVPEPPNWNGPGGNVFPQPERGQPLIDKALQLGYKPIVEEDLFYWHVYRELYHNDPNA